MTTRQVDKAARLIERANRQRIQVEALRERLEREQLRLDAITTAAFDALPDGYAISLGRDRPWTLVAPQESA